MNTKRFGKKGLFIHYRERCATEFCQIVNACLVLPTSIFFLHFTQKVVFVQLHNLALNNLTQR